MKLPPHILNSVKWFEYYSEPGVHTWGDRFVLHFCQWWKPNKTIWMEGIFHHFDEASKRHMYASSNEAKELYIQLKEHCKDQA